MTVRLGLPLPAGCVGGRLARICAGYSKSELAAIVDFLERAADAGATATEQVEGEA